MTEREWQLQNEIHTILMRKKLARGKKERKAYDRLHYILNHWARQEVKEGEKAL